MDDDSAKEIADHILEALQRPAKPEKPIYLSKDWAWNLEYYEELDAYRKALRKLREDSRRRWRISDREEQLLVKISSTFANRALLLTGDGDDDEMVDNGTS